MFDKSNWVSIIEEVYSPVVDDVLWHRSPFDDSVVVQFSKGEHFVERRIWPQEAWRVEGLVEILDEMLVELRAKFPSQVLDWTDPNFKDPI